MNHKIWMMLALTLSATGAQAADTYAGVDFLIADYQESAMSDSVAPKAIEVKYGIQMDQNLGVEFRLGTGISNGKTSNLLVNRPSGPIIVPNFEASLDLLLGAYGRAALPVTDNFQVYALAGVASIETTHIVPGINITNTDTNFSYGAGFAFKPNETTTISTEYMMLVDNNDLQITSLNLGFAMKF